MTAPQRLVSPSARRWAVVLGLSIAAHAAVLAGFAMRQPAPPRTVVLSVVDVRLAPRLPFARPIPAQGRLDDPRIRRSAVVLASTAPRYAGSAAADTGESEDAVDLFGPVFADGLWPRPLVVRRAPCDPDEPTEVGDACRRELMLIGLASDAAAGAKAQP